MNIVLETTKQVMDKAEDVAINPDVLQRTCFNIKRKDIAFWLDKTPFQTQILSEQDKLNFMFTMNAVNFCYWGEPKWTIEYQGKKLDGAWAMIASFHRALEEGRPIFSASYLENITEEDVDKILRGTPQIPLFAERVKILRQIGEGLNRRYQGSFVNVIESASKDALRLLDLITQDFPSYYDAAHYDGPEVVFHKRAQLAISDLHRTFDGKMFGEFRNVNELTAFADYKIPQVLRRMGILEYSPTLAERVDTMVEIPAGSPEEIEIRSGQICAIDRMKELLKSTIPDVKSMDLDSWAWLQGQTKLPNDKPYHRTRTIYY